MFSSSKSASKDDNTNKPQKRGLLRSLKSAFNKESLGQMALGAGVMAGAKLVTGAALTLTAAPAIPALAATVATGALVTMGLEHVKLVQADRKQRREEGEEISTSLKGRLSEYLSVKKFRQNFSENKSQFFKKAAMNATFGAAGGLAVVAADNIGSLIDTANQLKDQLLNGTTHTIVPPPEPIVTVQEPAIQVEASTEQDSTVIEEPIAEIVEEEPTGPQFNAEAPFSDESVQAITEYNNLNEMPYMDRMAYILDAISPKTEELEALYNSIQPDSQGNYSAYDYQQMKELARISFNAEQGFDQIPEDVREKIAVDLYQASADGGNIQAQTDLAYIQYHGLAEDTVSQDKEAALESINSIDKSWTGGEKLLDSYNPETADLPLINIESNNQITSCDVTEKTGRLLDDTTYDFNCHAPAHDTAKSGDYIEYKLNNFDIMGEDTVIVRNEFEGEPQSSLSFLSSSRDKFMSIVSRVKFGSSMNLAMN